MSKIVVDAVLRRQLLAITEPVELCDESGHVLGRFSPAMVDQPQSEFVEPPISDEELQRRSQAKERYWYYTTAEVLAYLEKL